MDKQSIIQALQLEPHIEGGYFKRSYSSQQSLVTDDSESRLLLSCIFYMLTDDSPIGFLHRNRSDIVHFWHAGSALTYYLIDPKGRLTTVALGPDIANGEQLQLTVPGGYWKATELKQGQFGLLSEAVSPGFEYSDMTLANSVDVKANFPSLWSTLNKFCKR